MCALARAETGHGDADDAVARPTQLVEGAYGDEQSQCRVQSARDAHHGGLGLDVLQARHKSLHLDVEDFGASRLHVIGRSRHERTWSHVAVELLLEVGCLELAQLDCLVAARARQAVRVVFAVEIACRGRGIGHEVAECALRASQHFQLFDIDVAHQNVRLHLEAFALAEHCPVFGDETLAGKDEVGR